jgi:hypothetical protein
MSNLKIGSLFLLSGLSCTAAYATQPTDTVSSDANANTAMGTSALLNLVNPVGACATTAPFSGCWNTAAGAEALVTNTTGGLNSAFGASALYANTSGYYNTANGSYSLFSNTTGQSNSGFGSGTLEFNTTGNLNTASGSYALNSNTTGSGNSAVGAAAMFSNSTGANNTAFGYLALTSNTTGKGNAAQGVNALFSNTTGIRNLGIGSNALYGNVTGSYNIALGFDAGYNVTSGSNNIEIGAEGTASDNATIQIGVQGTQVLTTIAGIYGTPVSGSAVFVTSKGQLGVQTSSERYKTDIATMPELSGKLSRLRPVTFHYKIDPSSAVQYGLIAEEVDRVYPELVIRDEAGKIQGVHYEELAPMLLREVQTQQAMIADQVDEIHGLKQQQQNQLAEIRDLKNLVLGMQAGLAELQAKDGGPAQR